MDELQKEARRKSVENASYLAAIVIGMVGVTYASVPLYRMFCQATGYGGTVQRAMVRPVFLIPLLTLLNSSPFAFRLPHFSISLLT